MLCVYLFALLFVMTQNHLYFGLLRELKRAA